MAFFNKDPIKFNIPKITFKSSPQTCQFVTNPLADKFVTNPLADKFTSAQQIEANIKQNPRIMKLLKQYNLPAKVNINELRNLQKGHLQHTRLVAAQIYSNLPQDLKQRANLKQIQDAALLHDYGKILIPDNILNKAGELTPDEIKIMQLHSELGYELLKDKGVDDGTLNLVKYHHQTPSGNGYPIANENFEYNINLQILNTADRYAALTEDRCYKKAMAKEEAINVLRHDVDIGLIKPEIFKTLKRVA